MRIISLDSQYIFSVTGCCTVAIKNCSHVPKVFSSDGRFLRSYYLFLLSMMFSVTGTGGMDNIIYNMRTSGHLIQSLDYNVIPLTNTDLTGLVLNVILFVPFGIILPVLWRPCSGKFVVQAGFFLSAAIELSQLFNWRSTDINDLITNTLGACLGYVLYKQLFYRIPWFQANDPHSKRTISCCIILIIAVYMCIASPVLNPII